MPPFALFRSGGPAFFFLLTLTLSLSSFSSSLPFLISPAFVFLYFPLLPNSVAFPSSSPPAFLLLAPFFLASLSSPASLFPSPSSSMHHALFFFPGFNLSLPPSKCPPSPSLGSVSSHASHTLYGLPLPTPVPSSSPSLRRFPFYEPPFLACLSSSFPLSSPFFPHICTVFFRPPRLLLSHFSRLRLISPYFVPWLAPLSRPFSALFRHFPYFLLIPSHRRLASIFALLLQHPCPSPPAPLRALRHIPRPLLPPSLPLLAPRCPFSPPSFLPSSRLSPPPRAFFAATPPFGFSALPPPSPRVTTYAPPYRHPVCAALLSASPASSSPHTLPPSLRSPACPSFATAPAFFAPLPLFFARRTRFSRPPHPPAHTADPRQRDKNTLAHRI
ncbi:hypothetical protein C7M84_021917 [Penaeus vannamei]|uniref:Uncharacterized protein n=1 Tax=Penaeus vannamei TaxID=6689 RepID=A0A3R7QZL0_PENVA|nr:hypothetical protein C7M84_021917 [Penaeus vannamei]